MVEDVLRSYCKVMAASGARFSFLWGHAPGEATQTCSSSQFYTMPVWAAPIRFSDCFFKKEYMKLGGGKQWGGEVGE